uniref:Uncharacterized protein n=1 Tax=viral metagenome TaxID=1070528 RepID=A0A6C0M262_9ZZZZ
MEIPPDHELVIVCHCRPCRRPKGYVPKYENEGDDLLDIVEDTADQDAIRTISDDAHFVDVSCPDASLERNKWSDVPDGTIQIVWGKACPVYPAFSAGLYWDLQDKTYKQLDPSLSIETVKDILDNSYPKLKPGGMVVFPLFQHMVREAYDKYNPGPQWRMVVSEHFPFLVKKSNTFPKASGGVIVFTKVPAGGRRRGRKTRRKTLRKRK